MFWKKTAKDLRVKELREAELALVTQLTHLDYHEAMARMYERRVVRLRQEVQLDTDEARDKAQRAQETAMSHG